MNLEQLLFFFKEEESFINNVTRWEKIPASRGCCVDFPKDLDVNIVKSLRQKGISTLYSHQREAWDALNRDENVVVVTPTASGKTLCYNLPVINEILKNPASRALYLFPTKALSQDQAAELNLFARSLGASIDSGIYDGDTPVSLRKKIRDKTQIVVSNPDMLHKAILPHHTRWVKLFENLKFVVIDEMHTYRGVFGSHVANVLRRLKRICNFYGSSPLFICSTATVANPEEFAARLIESPVTLIQNSGAPSGEKQYIFYNPPVVNQAMGIRRSSLLEARKICSSFISNGIQTIAFARSRLAVEVLLSYLKNDFKKKDGNYIRGYRGGYLPLQRREIEAGLRSGEVAGVVSTNALELGIDIGSLEASVIVGYPGSISSTWQQAGRAGRKSGLSAVVMLASASPLDQFIVNNPQYFFDSSPESGLVNPDNLYILISHLKCAAFELPFIEGERFGVETTGEILDYLAQERILRKTSGKYYWMAESFPAEEISLRSAAGENFIIIDITEENTPIGEVDRFSAPMLIHEGAIYYHEGKQFQIEKLDYANNKAYARKVQVNYYTDANLESEIKVLECFQKDKTPVIKRYFGEVMVHSLVSMYKKIKLYTHENIGSGPVRLPPEEMHTSSFWFTLNPEISIKYPASQRQSALYGLSILLANICPLFLFCDTRDIHSLFQPKSPFTGDPTVFIYDSCPGGIGLSEKVYQMIDQLFLSAYQLLKQCPCTSGCPSCIGAGEKVSTMKEDCSEILKELVQSDGGETCGF